MLLEQIKANAGPGWRHSGDNKMMWCNLSVLCIRHIAEGVRCNSIVMKSSAMVPWDTIITQVTAENIEKNVNYADTEMVN